MEKLINVIDWIQQIQMSAWECIVLVYYILLIVLFVIPLILGLVVIIATFILSSKLPKPPTPVSPTDNRSPKVTVISATDSLKCHSQAGRNAFTLELLKKQRNEYYFHSTTGSMHTGNQFPRRILKAILNDFLAPYTTTAIERVLVIMPPIQYFKPLLEKKVHYPQLEHGQSFANTGQHRFLPETSVNNCNDSWTREGDFSQDRLAYLDLSLTKYCSSSQSFYKEKRPIQFKFFPNS